MMCAFGNIGTCLAVLVALEGLEDCGSTKKSQLALGTDLTNGKSTTLNDKVAAVLRDAIRMSVMHPTIFAFGVGFEVCQALQY